MITLPISTIHKLRSPRGAGRKNWGHCIFSSKSMHGAAHMTIVTGAKSREGLKPDIDRKPRLGFAVFITPTLPHRFPSSPGRGEAITPSNSPQSYTASQWLLSTSPYLVPRASSIVASPSPRLCCKPGTNGSRFVSTISWCSAPLSASVS
jgi:hypothetical protein